MAISSVPNTFVAGNPALASEVNANFAALVADFNDDWRDNDTAVTSPEFELQKFTDNAANTDIVNAGSPTWTLIADCEITKPATWSSYDYTAVGYVTVRCTDPSAITGALATAQVRFEEGDSTSGQARSVTIPQLSTTGDYYVDVTVWCNGSDEIGTVSMDLEAIYTDGASADLQVQKYQVIVEKVRRT